MSTLTKVLIVLLTVFSVFLCGIVVTYVAHADNQKKIAEDYRRNVKNAQDKQKGAEQDLAAAKDEFEKKQAELNATIAQLKNEKGTLEAQVAELNRLKTKAEQDMAEQSAKAAIDANLAQSANQMYAAARQEISALTADQTDRKKELDELNVTLMEKMTLIAQLEEKNRQLTEASQDLSNRLDQYLQKYGKMAGQPKVATATTGIALPATTVPVRNIALNGKIVGVDLQNKLAQVSLGSAQGVAPNMTFHVFRGEQFICDIVIDKVDPDKAVGKLEIFDRNWAEPRVGDAVSTNI